MISHDEAKALISARLDRQLDPASEQQLAQHLQGCESCRRFAVRMAAMQTGIRELPYLPPSPTVRQAVMAEVRNGRTVTGRLAAWLGQFSLSPGPLATIGATAVLVLVVVATLLTSTVLNQGSDGNDPSGTQVALQGASENTRAAATVTQAESERTGTRAPAVAPPVATVPNVPGDGNVATETPISAQITTATDVPATDVPATDVPATDVPATDVPATDVPATDVPATDVPATDVPATDVPATDVPATDVPATDVPATAPSMPTATPDDSVQAALLPPTETTGASTAPDTSQARSGPTTTPDVGSTEPAPTESAEPTATETSNGISAALTRPATPTATAEPSATPAEIPATTPTGEPTANATAVPTYAPTATATDAPTVTAEPTATPTDDLAQAPIATAEPTNTPTEEPAATSTATPTEAPTRTPTEVPTATNEPTASPTDEPTATASATSTAEPTATPTDEPTAMATATSTAEPTATPTEEPTATATATAEPTATPTEEPTAMAMATATATATATEEPTATQTEEPTAIPTEEPTLTAEPSATATGESGRRGNPGINPTDNNTPIPAGETEPATSPADGTEPTVASDEGQAPDQTAPDGQATETPAVVQPEDTPTPAPTATEIAAKAQTPTPATTTTPGRRGINPTDGNTPIPAGDPNQPTIEPTIPAVESATEPVEPTATVPTSGDDQVIQPRGSDNSGSGNSGDDNSGNGGNGGNGGSGNGGNGGDGGDGTDTTGGGVGAGDFSIDSAPVTTGVSLGAAPPGPLRVSPDGGLFLFSDGGNTIGVASFNGGETVLGTFYYPVWTSQGQVLATYYPDNSGSSAIGLISLEGGLTAVTTPDPDDAGRRDIAAGEIGGSLYYQRNWPNEPDRGIELHRVSGGNDEVIWEDTGLVPVSKHPSLSPNGTFLIATNDGWYQVDGNGGASALGGSVGVEPVGIAFGPGGAVAVLGGGQLALGTVGNPGGGTVIGGVGDGAGVAWSPDGSRIAVASGPVVSIYDTGGNLLRTFTSDAGALLSGLLWSGDLLVVRGGGQPGVISIPASALP